MFHNCKTCGRCWSFGKEGSIRLRLDHVVLGASLDALLCQFVGHTYARVLKDCPVLIVFMMKQAFHPEIHIEPSNVEKC